MQILRTNSNLIRKLLDSLNEDKIKIVRQYKTLFPWLCKYDVFTVNQLSKVNFIHQNMLNKIVFTFYSKKKQKECSLFEITYFILNRVWIKIKNVTKCNFDQMHPKLWCNLLGCNKLKIFNCNKPFVFSSTWL